MMFGVILERAPQDWQILQQENSFAMLEAEGRFEIPEGVALPEPTVYLRLVREDSGADVTGWQKAETLPGNRWKGTIRMPAGGLYRLETCLNTAKQVELEWSARGDMRHHLGAGDLFVIAGQSNSAGYGKDPLYDPPEMGVHLLRNSLRWDLATHPMNDSTDSVHIVNTEGANSGSCPYLSFGKMLRRELGYPIGLLQTSLGGSPLSRWNPAENGDLYASMLEVIRSQGGKIRGVLWYQGCSDTGEHLYESYEERFGQMMDSLEANLGYRTHWLTVQLNRQLFNGSNGADEGWGTIREVQRQLARKCEYVSVVPTTDCGLSDGIHNNSSGNLVIGERLAAAALRDIYGRVCGSPAPDLETAELTQPDTITLTFSGVFGWLCQYGSLNTVQHAFTAEDAAGEIPVIGLDFAKDKIMVRLSRPVGENCRISGGWQMDPPLLPVDYGNHQPILSFYQVPVER